MSRSDIFDNYAKIAEENGLISLAEDEPSSQPPKPKESAKLKRYKKDSYPRAGSDDISTIEALYGVKPDDSIKYEFNIMEAAHPKPVVVSPSYDKINGLFENNIERQNIIHNIVMKPVNGNEVNHKYAEKQLMLELIRVANEMDNQGNDEIRIIADDCLDSLKKKAFEFGEIGDWLKSKFDTGGLEDAVNVGKGLGSGATIGFFAGSIIGALVGGLGGGGAGAVAGAGVGAAPGAVAGALSGALAGGRLGMALGAEAGFIASLLGKTPPIVRNVSINAKETSAKIEALKKAIKTSDQNNDPTAEIEIVFLEKFQVSLASLAASSDRYQQAYASANSMVQSDPDAEPTDVKPATDAVVKASSELVKQITIIKDFINKFNNKVASNTYKTWVSPSKPALLTVYRFIDDDVQSVESSVRSLLQSIKQFNDLVSKADQAVKSKSKQNKPAPKQEESEEEDNQKPQDEESEEEDDDSTYSSISKMLGHKPGKKELDFFNSLK